MAEKKKAVKTEKKGRGGKKTTMAKKPKGKKKKFTSAKPDFKKIRPVKKRTKRLKAKKLPPVRLRAKGSLRGGKKTMRKSLYCLFLICAGIVLGTLVAALCADISALSWLTYGLDFGLTEPFVLDLAVFKLTFGLSLDLNVAVVIFVALSLAIGLALYRKK